MYEKNIMTVTMALRMVDEADEAPKKMLSENGRRMTGRFLGVSALFSDNPLDPWPAQGSSAPF